MEAQVNLTVQFRGETQSFLVSDPRMTTWADVEAMVKLSFDLDDVQLKYMDEDNEEVSVNSQGEYEEALKSAVKQGNQLRVNVYEETPSYSTENTCCKSSCEAVPVVKEMPKKKDGKKPLKHYSMLARTIGQEMKLSQEAKEKELKQNDADWSMEKPPVWFTRYMDNVRQQIVKDTVETLRREFQEKLTFQLQPRGSPNCTGPALQFPESHPPKANTYDWLLACSNCQTRIVGIRYQCSVCPGYSVCELCEAGDYAHDPNHVFLKLRRPALTTLSETCMSGKFSGVPLPARLQKQLDRNLLKAEKQRLKAEKRQRKAEMEELKKQLKLHKKIHLWNPAIGAEGFEPATAAKLEGSQPSPVTTPVLPCTPVVPTLNAVFVDENLPDGTHMPPGSTFTKHWEMKNTGNVEWSDATRLIFMWGNLHLAPPAKKEVPVPFLQPGQTGKVSVDFAAPAFEGTYTSHWRLAHKGMQFGPRVWCSIIVDLLLCQEGLQNKENNLFSSPSKQEVFSSASQTEKQAITEAEEMESSEMAVPLKKLQTMVRGHELYIPSVDLLTAQDLLSFELLDINIVQELERVPHNTPVDMTPCMSPLPHDGPLIEKPGLGQIAEENEGTGLKALLDVTLGKKQVENASVHEEGEEDISGTQFVCETVIRSLAMDEAPDHKPPRRSKANSPQSSLETVQETFSYSVKSTEDQGTLTALASANSGTAETEIKVESVEERKEAGADGNVISSEEGIHSIELPEEQEEDDDSDEVQSQGSSTFSEDYIIVLPDCFDTSRPLAESMYSSALSQPGAERDLDIEAELEALEDRTPEGASRLQVHSVNDMLCASQTLDAVPLTPEVVPTLALSQRKDTDSETSNLKEPELLVVDEVSFPAPEQPREVPAGQDSEAAASPSETVNFRRKSYEQSRSHGGIAGGLVKGALSVAASAYKALFAGQQHSQSQPRATQDEAAAMMAVLFEMGFCDRQLNQRLLKKHNYNLMEVVTELIQINDNDWYANRY